MPFETFDLGRVMQTAEAIKTMKRAGTMDKLQEEYLGQRIQAGKQEMAQQARAEQVVMGKEKAQQVAVKTGQLLQAEDLKGAIERTEPVLREVLEQQGLDWATADNDTLRQHVTTMQNRANQELGVSPVTTQQVGGFNTLQQGGKVITAAAPKEATPDAVTERWKQEVQGGYKGSLLDYQKELKAAGRAPAEPVSNKPPAGYRWKPDGSLEAIPGGPATPKAKTGNVTEGERKAAALGTRLDASLTALKEIAKRDPDASRPGFWERGFESAGMEAAANASRSDERQQADAAQLDALDAALTLATGAAYTKEQLSNLRKAYFPQIGDSDANVKAKEKRFETIVKTARIASGRAEPSIDRANQRGASGTWGEPGQSVQVGDFTVRRVK